MLRGETNHQSLQFVSYQNVNDELQKKFLNLIASQNVNSEVFSIGCTNTFY
jgi:hypothetical protein